MLPNLKKGIFEEIESIFWINLLGWVGFEAMKGANFAGDEILGNKNNVASFR